MTRILNKKTILPVSVFAFALFLFSFFIQVDDASAHFSDSFRAQEKTLSAGYLDSNFNDEGWGDSGEIEMSLGKTKDREVLLTNSGSLSFQYLFDVEIYSGSDQSFCDSLELEAELDGERKYKGPITDFDLQSSEVLDAGDSSNWNFILKSISSSGAFSGSECRVEIVFNSWQLNLESDHGFSYETGLGEDTIVFENSSGGGGSNNQPEVVINEIMWAGSNASSWIELRNLSDQEADISDWVLENAKSGGGDYVLPDDSTIVAEGFFLISRYPSTSTDSALAVSQDERDSNLNFSNDYSGNGQVILRDSSNNIVDKTPEPTGSSWPEGENVTSGEEKKWSMQRGSNPGDGSDTNNWYTCDRDVLDSDGTLNEMEGYWEDGYSDIMCGTPGHMNLSSNDPTKSGAQSSEATGRDRKKDVQDVEKDSEEESGEPEGSPDSKDEDQSEAEKDKEGGKCQSEEDQGKEQDGEEEKEKEMKTEEDFDEEEEKEEKEKGGEDKKEDEEEDEESEEKE